MVRGPQPAPGLRTLSFLLLLGSIAAHVACADPPPRADVVGVKAVQRSGGVHLAVTVRSPDAGCDRYADWWEVVSPEGRLLYRRILQHSHVDEQPFTRLGGPVPIAGDTEVVVRAHMRPSGYTGAVLRGSVSHGFHLWPDVPPDFAEHLAQVPPLPAKCRY